MKKTILFICLISILSICSVAFAEEENVDTSVERITIPEEITPNANPPIVVDENFNAEVQDFLNDETVKTVKIYETDNNNSYNNEIVLTSGTPYLDSDGRMRVPVRDVAAALGYEVKWYPETGQIGLFSSKNEYEWYILTPYDNIVVYRETDKNTPDHMIMDCCPHIIDGVTYLPIRHIANMLMRNTIWDKDNLTVTLYPHSVINVDESGVIYVESNRPR